MKIGILSDIHEDIIRTQQAIEILQKCNCDKIVFLGDAIGIAIPYYGYLQSRDSNKVINLLQEVCDLMLIGNHDLYCIQKIPTSGVFNYPKNRYSLDYNKRFDLGNGQIELHEYNELSPMLTSENKEYLYTLPDHIIKEYDGMNILFSHWLYPDFAGSNKFIPSHLEEYNDLFKFMQNNNCHINIVGHSHRQRYYFSQKGLININFNEKITIDNKMGGFVIPCVANGTFPNGVAILNTTERTMEYLPLNSQLHVIPEWVNK